jgi:hypothetical protein
LSLSEFLSLQLFLSILSLYLPHCLISISPYLFLSISLSLTLSSYFFQSIQFGPFFLFIFISFLDYISTQNQLSFTLFHVTPVANLFYIGGGGDKVTPRLTLSFIKIGTWNLVTMFIFEFRIKVTSSTMPNVLLDNRLFVKFRYLRS